MKRLMVDIEALSSAPNACLLQIGAVYFTPNPDGSSTIGEGFNMFINPVDSARSGGHICPSTVLWWLKQEDAARKPMINLELNGFTEAEAIASYSSFAHEAAEIWCHATYDFVCLNQAFSRHKMKGPSFRKSRDIRTLNGLSTETDLAASMVIPREGVHHDAYSDAVYQAKYVSFLLSKLQVIKG